MPYFSIWRELTWYLESLGWHLSGECGLIGWGKQIMQFQMKEQWVELKGARGSDPAQVSLQSLFGKPMRMIDGLFFSTETRLSGTEGQGVQKGKLSSRQGQALQDLLDQYEEVFKETKGLPPKREEEHAIVLLEGQDPINVRSYRYPHHHKNEIEKQVLEMLELGMIRHSQSAFSSLVILVKKKDDSWWMCVDYRALNKVTVPNNSPYT